MTRARTAATNAHLATYVHPTGAGNQHIPAAGAAGQALLYASAGTAAWGTISTGPDQIVNPTFSSPDSTFTTSGTYSKPASVADDDYMWVFMVNGGRGGDRNGQYYINNNLFYAAGGYGGNPLLLYGKASNFHNATYVIGAGGTGGTSSTNSGTVGGSSSITLHSSQGGYFFGTATSAFVHYVGGGAVVIGGTTLVGGFTGGNTFLLPAIHTGWATVNTSADYHNQGGSGGYNYLPRHSVFGGGGGGGAYGSSQANATAYGQSFLSGDGGPASTSGAGTDGALHGGGGGAGNTTGGDGGSGSMRVYYV